MSTANWANTPVIYQGRQMTLREALDAEFSEIFKKYDVEFTQALQSIQDPESDLTLRLSPAERRIFLMVGEGMTTLQIAKKIYRSRHTIETHIYRMCEKLNLPNTPAVRRAAIRYNLKNVFGEPLVEKIDGI